MGQEATGSAVDAVFLSDLPLSFLPDLSLVGVVVDPPASFGSFGGSEGAALSLAGAAPLPPLVAAAPVVVEVIGFSGAFIMSCAFLSSLARFMRA